MLNGNMITKLGFESKIQGLRDEVDKLNQEQNRLRAELLLLPLIGPKLVKLTQRWRKRARYCQYSDCI